MPWGIDKVELVSLTILRGVMQGDRLSFDRNATFTLDIHRIEDLSCHFAFSETTADLYKAVGNGRLTMVDMRDDGEVTDVT